MSLVSRIRQAFAPKEKAGVGAALPAMGYLPTLGSTPSTTGLNISQGTAMAVSTVYACVTIRSQDTARCTPRLFRRQSDGSRVQNTTHPLCKVFRRPNRVQTWFEFMEQMNAACLLRGNAYAAIKRDGRGVISELIPVNPDVVLVLEGFDGQIFYNVNRLGLWQIAMLREFPSSIASEDIFHLRGLSLNALMALSTIGVARDSIGVSDESLEIDMDETVLLRADITTRYNSVRVGMLTGFLSPNEVRAGENLPPVEGGDEVYPPLNMAALGSDATGTAPDGAGHPAAGEGDTPGADNVPTHGPDERETPNGGQPNVSS
ncbi:MAG: phage portal protein [Methylocella sp.]